MKTLKQRNAGVTMLELLLVLAIAASIIVLGIQQVNSYRVQLDAEQLRVNVNKVFQAAANFYQANCSRQWDASGPITTSGSSGVLDPMYNPAPTSPYPITLETLRTQGFLTEPLTANRLVKGSDANPDAGYTVQFNRTVRPKSVYVTSTTTRQIGQLVIWRIQVGVELSNPDTAQQMINILQGNCLTTVSGDIVIPCDQTQAGTTHLVWERLPSLASPDSASEYIYSNPLTKQFNDMYRTYPILYLTSIPSTPIQNYLCGS